MKWHPEADAAIRKAPFFVRKRVRSRVEAHVAEAGRKTVTLADVHAVRRQYLENMEKEVRGYRVETCFGPGGCPNRAGPEEDLACRLEALLAEKRLLEFLKSTVSGPLKFHHEFCVTVADCPNACSQPQVRDIGIIGAAVPEVTRAPCSMCEACTEACREGAVRLNPLTAGPEIAWSRCLMCGQCAEACPGGTIRTARRAYKILLGGKLGRHPRLAEALAGCYDAPEVLAITGRCVDFYKQNSTGGKRFAQLYAESGDALLAELSGFLKDADSRSAGG